MGKQYFPDRDPPAPVRVCAFCARDHHKDTVGYESVRMEMWFCTTACYEVYRYISGRAEITTPGFAAELIRLKNKYFTKEIIDRRKERLREQIQQGRIKPILRDNGHIVITADPSA